MERPKLYTPRETAKKLGISTRMLQYHRSVGHIEGIEAGTTTLYTDDQIAAANFKKRKPGPKSVPAEKSGESDAFALAG